MNISIPPQSLLCPLLHPPLKFTTYPTTICIYNVLYINILSPISIPHMSMGVVLTTGVWATYHMVPPEENRFLLQQLMGTSSRPTPTPHTGSYHPPTLFRDGHLHLLHEALQWHQSSTLEPALDKSSVSAGLCLTRL